MMEELWPWLVVAGVGALHGLNPATGWILAAAWGIRSKSRTKALQALVPIAAGHAASVALVAAAVWFGLSLDRTLLQAAAGGLGGVALIVHLSCRTRAAICAPAGHAGLALWSFMVATLHGAGLMLVPALVPLCAGAAAGKTSASSALLLAFAAAGVHTAAMLLVSGLIAAGACRGFDTVAAWLRGLRPSLPPPASRR